MWFRHEEDGHASKKYYELFHGRENNYFSVGNMWYVFPGINFLCGAYLVYTWNIIFKSELQLLGNAIHGQNIKINATHFMETNTSQSTAEK